MPNRPLGEVALIWRLTQALLFSPSSFPSPTFPMLTGPLFRLLQVWRRLLAPALPALGHQSEKVCVRRRGKGKRGMGRGT